MKKFLIALISSVVVIGSSIGDEIEVRAATVDGTGRVQIHVASTSANYYVLYRRNDDGGSERAVSISFGASGGTILTESLGASSVDRYRVVEYRIDDPEDSDGDGINDLEELRNPSRLAPLNPASEIGFRDGVLSIPDRETFERLSYQGEEVLIDTHLRDLEYVKFYLLETDTKRPELLFMNTVTHRAHRRFASAVGIPGGSGGRGRGGGSLPGQMRGEIVYHPSVLAPSGRRGVYRFEFEPNDAYSFIDVEMTYELLAANMPFLRNNLVYYPMPRAALPRYLDERSLYDSSRVEVMLEEDLFASVDYLPFNVAEGYGILRTVDLTERPNARDIVIYEALPNDLPRVGGIITTTPQTPLSHVNLRAIQDGVPNAYIEGALDDDTISGLLGRYVFFRVRADGYEIRAATINEVAAHYTKIRPSRDQILDRDFTVRSILPLDEIEFEQSISFGGKTGSLAVLRSMDFEENTVPRGFGVPFYFYDEFMKFNRLYQYAEELLSDEEFSSDFNRRGEMLAELRERIEKGNMPMWMSFALTGLQSAFPVGASIRVRSSTNNEDLPGWSGAGLYDSKTQHPDEGHISKSVKQVFASLWNFRAFEEREFYRIDHFTAAMGLLVHTNFSNEIANGVAVTFDPFYQSESTYYLNAQVGEDLVTNPSDLSIPEEVLVSTERDGDSVIMRPSNRVPSGGRVISLAHIAELKSLLSEIDRRFRSLYRSDYTGMEIEFKITEDDEVAIKQARPWVR